MTNLQLLKTLFVSNFWKPIFTHRIAHINFDFFWIFWYKKAQKNPQILTIYGF